VKSSVTRPQLEQTLSEATFISSYSFQLVSFAYGTCTIRAPFKASNLRPGGVLGGPLLMTAADVATWLAIITAIGPDEMAVTTELNTTFLGSAKSGSVECRAQLLKVGRRLIFGTAECTAQGGKLLTHHTMTYQRI